MGSYQSLRKSIYQNLVQHAPNCRWKVLESIFVPTMRNTNRIPAKVTNTFIKVFTVSRFQKILLFYSVTLMVFWGHDCHMRKYQRIYIILFLQTFLVTVLRTKQVGNLVSDELIVCTMGLNSFCAFLSIEKCPKTTLFLCLINQFLWSRSRIPFAFLDLHFSLCHAKISDAILWKYSYITKYQPSKVDLKKCLVPSLWIVILKQRGTFFAVSEEKKSFVHKSNFSGEKLCSLTDGGTLRDVSIAISNQHCSIK